RSFPLASCHSVDSCDPAFTPDHIRRLDVWQRSGENLQRYVEIVIHDSNVFWYSGGSARNERASFMAYVSTAEGHWPWYVGLRRTDKWRVVKRQEKLTPFRH